MSRLDRANGTDIYNYFDATALTHCVLSWYSQSFVRRCVSVKLMHKNKNS